MEDRIANEKMILKQTLKTHLLRRVRPTGMRSGSMADLTLGVPLVDLKAGCCRWLIAVDTDDAVLFCGAERRHGSPSY